MTFFDERDDPGDRDRGKSPIPAHGSEERLIREVCAGTDGGKCRHVN